MLDSLNTAGPTVPSAFTGNTPISLIICCVVMICVPEEVKPTWTGSVADPAYNVPIAPAMGASEPLDPIVNPLIVGYGIVPWFSTYNTLLNDVKLLGNRPI